MPSASSIVNSVKIVYNKYMGKAGYGLTSNMLKILAAAFMVIDHIAFFRISPNLSVYWEMRAAGRLAFPIFAYFIAEGCIYTKNKLQYLSLMVLAALIAEIVFSVARNYGIDSGQMSIFATFSLSIIACYIYSYAEAAQKNRQNGAALFYILLTTVYLAAVFYFTTYYINVEYSFGGIALIFAVYLTKPYLLKLAGLIIGCLMIYSLNVMTRIQLYSLLAAPLLLLYDGTRGKLKMKYFFYTFYPLHVILILIL